MTNKIAICLAALILAGLVYDYIFNDWTGALFLAKKFADMIEWLAFWR